MTVWAPVADGVYSTEQLDWPSVASGLRLQVAPFEKPPAPLVEKLIVPLGVVLVSPSVSLTVAVHVLGPLTTTEEGEQPRLVAVVRLVAVSVSAPLLPACASSPS